MRIEDADKVHELVRRRQVLGENRTTLGKSGSGQLHVTTGGAVYLTDQDYRAVRDLMLKRIASDLEVVEQELARLGVEFPEPDPPQLKVVPKS